MDGPVQIEFHLHQSWIGLAEQAVVERLSTRAVEKLEIVVVIGEAERRIARLGRDDVQPGDYRSEPRLGPLFLGQPGQHYTIGLERSHPTRHIFVWGQGWAGRRGLGGCRLNK